MPRANVLALAALALVGWALIGPASGRSQAPALEGFGGTFTLAADRRELSAMSDAINRVADQMNIFIREIARGEIHRRVVPEQRIRIEVLDDERLTLALDTWGPVEARLGAPTRTRGSAGEATTLTVRYGGGRLVQQSVTPQGRRTNVFALSGDQQRLFMSVRIGSDQLPSDIRYRLTYRRSGS